MAFIEVYYNLDIIVSDDNCACFPLIDYMKYDVLNVLYIPCSGGLCNDTQVIRSVTDKVLVMVMPLGHNRLPPFVERGLFFF